MDNGDQRTEHVFLVRMWRERGGADPQWRGSVQHVATGRRLFVGSAAEVGDFISLQLRSDPSVQRR
ncbi:MAG TPA: hypothetical protein VFO25_13965 [Candidatus Eremiobacteraceae bacterium]|nr:hypothetical protein [Candidatus Eremiobacteraceae bacterium]